MDDHVAVPAATGSRMLALVAIMMGAVAAVLLGTSRWLGAFPSEDWDPLAVPLGLVGVVLLAWAALLTGWQVVHLCSRWMSGHPVARPEALLTAAAVGVMVVLLLAFPLWGSGGASA